MTLHRRLLQQARILRRIQATGQVKPYPADLLMLHMGVTPAQVLTNKSHYNQTLGRIFEGLVLSAFIDHPQFEPIWQEPARMQLADLVLGGDGIELKYSVADTTPYGEKIRNRRDALRDEGLNPVVLVFRDCEKAARAFKGWQLHMGDGCIDYIERRSGQTFQQLLDAHAAFLEAQP